MTSFGLFRQVWLFRDLAEYNAAVQQSSGPEVLIEQRVPVPITHLDRDRVDIYIVRADLSKEYYA
jgi:hypothetical protein